MKYPTSVAAAAALSLTFAAGAAQAGAVFLTGHDPDFHSQGQVSGQNQLNVALNFVTGGTYNDAAPTKKFLWVESRDPILGGHRRGFDGLATIGVGAADVDWVDATQLAGVDLKDYSAIAIASSFGGMLSDAELAELKTRSSDIADFINAGGGLAAFAECYLVAGCDNAGNVTSAANLFAYLPITVVSVGTAAPYKVTPYGASLGLTNADVDDCCTHNSFSETGGLNVVDTDQNGIATTLAGVVKVGGGGFMNVPEPAAWTLMLVGFGGVGALLRRRRSLAGPLLS
ncbi:PEPxxWA-CTERM sorting domain-containing protein [Phenylobacterium sp.]|uniref:PEPxxWA-CTERM sorting domain-containing protein n=1 Tax=Phenylobacterium sp. TaxID=1871053 RepID=UPI0025D35872|nr:PEPxxWA-CTERM sorting domain-containing protein [Phenylobacterium sp.]